MNFTLSGFSPQLTTISVRSDHPTKRRCSGFDLHWSWRSRPYQVLPSNLKLRPIIRLYIFSALSLHFFCHALKATTGGPWGGPQRCTHKNNHWRKQLRSFFIRFIPSFFYVLMATVWKISRRDRKTDHQSLRTALELTRVLLSVSLNGIRRLLPLFSRQKSCLNFAFFFLYHKIIFICNNTLWPLPVIAFLCRLLALES